MFLRRKKHTPLCTKEDARFFLLLCFGRDALHDSEIARREGGKPFAVLKTLLKSSEFLRGVLEPLMMGKALAHRPYSKAQQAVLRSGAKRHLDIALKTAETHRAVLRQMIESPRFLEALDASDNGYSAHWFASTIEASSATAAPNIVGNITELSSSRCRGYAYDTDRAGESLQLEFYINGVFVGTQNTYVNPSANTANTQADITGTGSGASSGASSGAGSDTGSDVSSGLSSQAEGGFCHTFSVPSHLAGLHLLVLSVYESTTGAPICPPREFANMGSRSEPLLIKLIARLEALQETAPDDLAAAIDDITKALPALNAFAAMPVENYPQFKQLYAPVAPLVTDTATTVSVGSFETINEGADLLIFVENGDRLAPNAENWIKACATENPEASLFFSDFDSIDTTTGAEAKPILRTALDAELMLQQPLDATAFAVRGAALAELGGLQALEPNARAYDLWLRLYHEKGASGFCHIPHVLWQCQNPPSHHSDMTPYLRAASAYLERTAPGAAAICHGDKYGGSLSSCLEIQWPIDPKLPKLAIIIPMKEGLSLTQDCLDSLRRTLAHPDHSEIIIVDNGSKSSETKDWLKWVDHMDGIQVLLHDAPFNWALMNNIAVQQTDAEYLLFLNNDTTALDHGWDHILRGYLNRTHVGAVGARLLFPNGTVQFGGYITNPEYIVLKEAYCESPSLGGYHHRSQLAHQTSALIGAFLACRRSTFEDVGGFDATRLPVAFNDIDFCLSLEEKGYETLYVPAITLYHHESFSRGYDAEDAQKQARVTAEQAIMREKWGARLAADPWYPAAFHQSEPTHSLLAAPTKAAIKHQP